LIGSPDVAVFIGLLIAVAVVAVAVRFVNVPYSVALVLTGLALALAPNAPSVQLTPAVILTVFLPVLLFHGAYNLDLADVRANFTPVALFAVPGVLVTAALVGAALHYGAALQWGTALIFGAIVGATDPVAVLAIFGEVGAPRRLATIVSAESLFNDGTALVIFSTILGVVTSGAFNGGATVERFVIVVAGSLALGAAVGVLGGTVMARLDDALIETTITVILAYGGYLLADRLTVSGPLETVMAGLVLGSRGVQVMSATTLLQARATWQFLDFLFNSLLFLLVGLAVRPLGVSAVLGFGPTVWKALAVSIVAVVVARALVVWAVAHLLAHMGRPLPRGWRTVVTWAGLRGAVSLAAALSLPDKLPDRALLLVLTFGIVLFTLLGQGLTIGRVMAWLHIGGDDASRHEFELALGRLRATEAALHEVGALRDGQALDTNAARRLEGEYAERERALRQQVATLRHGAGTLERQREVEAQRRLLRVQREAVRHSYAYGQISNTSLRELVAELDEELAKLEPALENE
jgi:CPA1 family monovalent cation:H+ antiporter